MKRLGKGLDALFATENTDDKGIRELRINEIEPSTGQPRKSFDDDKLVQLSESIKQHGVVQPIIVKKENDIYRIVAGERRWRAARIAGLMTVPAVIREISGRQVMEIALIENLQREDLNPIEEAEAYERLIKEYEMTQEEISATVGRSRPAIANSLRILSLNDTIKGYVISGNLSSGHARALIALEDMRLQQKAAEEIIKREMSVRETERLVKKYLSDKTKAKKEQKDIEYMEIEDRLKNIFGTKVRLITNNKKGKIMIEYYSIEELDRILELMSRMDKK